MPDLSTFPTGKISALTMLYLEKSDIASLTPTQLAEKYDCVYEEISQHFKDKKHKKHDSFYER